jgi:hypothetical protein
VDDVDLSQFLTYLQVFPILYFFPSVFHLSSCIFFLSSHRVLVLELENQFPRPKPKYYPPIKPIYEEVKERKKKKERDAILIPIQYDGGVQSKSVPWTTPQGQSGSHRLGLAEPGCLRVPIVCGSGGSQHSAAHSDIG